MFYVVFFADEYRDFPLKLQKCSRICGLSYDQQDTGNFDIFSVIKKWSMILK